MSVVIRRSPDMSFSPRLLILAVLITLMSVVGATTLAPHHDPLLLPVNSSVPAVTSTISAGDTAWLLTSGALVSLMTPGLAFFYGGLVESTTVLNTLMMSYVCAAIVTIQFLVFGYSLAFSGPSSFFGDGAVVVMKNLNQDAVSNLSPNPNVPHAAFIFFELQFATLTPALISGAVIGRLRFRTWVLFVLIWSTFVYDQVAFWVWSSHGWLRQLGLLDFAGGTVVHISAGFSALIASLVVGERSASSQQMRAHNVPFVLLGAALLNFGWFGFNGGSAFSSGNDGLAALACFNTAIGSSTGFLTWSIMEFAYQHKFSAIGAAMGIVSGLVSITPGCGYVSPMSAVAVSAIGTIAAFFGVRFKTLLSADDVLDVFACHGVGGFAGTVLTGCFASLTQNKNGNDGLFFGNAQLFGVQLIGAVVVALLASTVTFLILHLLKRIPYIGLRPTPEEESSGLDLLDHGSTAYMLMAAAGELQRRLRSQGIDPRSLDPNAVAPNPDELSVLMEPQAVADASNVEIEMAAGQPESSSLAVALGSSVQESESFRHDQHHGSQSLDSRFSLPSQPASASANSTSALIANAQSANASSAVESRPVHAADSPAISDLSNRSSLMISVDNSSGSGSGARRVSEQEPSQLVLDNSSSKPSSHSSPLFDPSSPAMVQSIRSSPAIGTVRRHSEQDIRRSNPPQRRGPLAEMEEMMLLAAQFDLSPGEVLPLQRVGSASQSASSFAQQIESIMARATTHTHHQPGLPSRNDNVLASPGNQHAVLRSHSSSDILSMQFQQLQRLQQRQSQLPQ